MSEVVDLDGTPPNADWLRTQRAQRRARRTQEGEEPTPEQPPAPDADQRDAVADERDAGD